MSHECVVGHAFFNAMRLVCMLLADICCLALLLCICGCTPRYCIMTFFLQVLAAVDQDQIMDKKEFATFQL